jgi:ubiquinone/menaquinone biosynthesis C-methylase UbiE
MSGVWFRLMALEFRIRYFLNPRDEVLNEVGMKRGFSVLDYGCGPGGYVLPACKLVGETGRLYALDINPLAIKMVKKLVKKKGLKNVETILSDCATGLPSESVDAVLLYDVFHDLEDQKAVLEELHRVLKQNGILSFSDHHLKETDILSMVTNGKLFGLLRKGERTYSFVKNKKANVTT